MCGKRVIVVVIVTSKPDSCTTLTRAMHLSFGVSAQSQEGSPIIRTIRSKQTCPEQARCNETGHGRRSACSEERPVQTRFLRMSWSIKSGGGRTGGGSFPWRGGGGSNNGKKPFPNGRKEHPCCLPHAPPARHWQGAADLASSLSAPGHNQVRSCPAYVATRILGSGMLAYFHPTSQSSSGSLHKGSWQKGGAA